MSDFANSWEQKQWASEVAEHARMLSYIERFPITSKLVQYAVKRILVLEQNNPKLKNNV